ncbi:bifunctional 3,4-dihydroxy-2-butanone-4-phosphate synthase/GTP cyclohydrolase II [Alkalilimnicola sp. S0819]|uniref:bifunctional 3,4-dihydroxy-2-butanone-4-phosphate synthase/GTP cyclohydrolase II n=1 Tax=Alkalilimnicola sp. S0819 TaxID=2613922 RepID=UPI00126241B1|nr:bifunctional 3,4-dihydroxy-2-butanone-4-phosphate synthase/GTP cyclohydrolase II [Alkalilimnicola sp. S0819]KAB7622761.1 3,4-dihydroxy-2-butanone-4-phosphate synthase [Alkalilimnicola sp. S0819]MPQ17255.1 3,4-dihydroxy-2-butanone-4-phosphate synthase [Alkalilimnicola sp. S0819]
MSLNSIEEIIEDLRQGKMVVIMDDEDRENEGDLLMASSMVRPEDINFMARYGRGLICLTLTRDRCEQLRLPLMVSDTDRKQSTNFTVSIEAATGVTTGISAADRARTVQAAVAPNARPEDLTQPGHVFPLVAQAGGVLTRAGHTEAGCDFARLAGFEPSAVIVEILNEDGTMARRDDLEKFAREHGLKIGTVADLISYRIRNERSVERVSDCELPTEFGVFHLYAYQDNVDNALHFALVKGRPSPEEPSLVRVHIQNTLSDVLASEGPFCGWPLRSALKQVAEAGEGVVVVLRRPNDVPDILRRMRDFQFRAAEPQHTEAQTSNDLRTYGLGAQILSDLGVRKMRVLSSPKRMHALSGFGMEVVEYVEQSQ